MALRPDPHTVLGVPHDATEAEIRHAFRSRLREHHPDTRGKDAAAAVSDLALRRILAAYATLRHDSSKAADGGRTRLRHLTPRERPSTPGPPTADHAALRVTPLQWRPADESASRTITDASLAVPNAVTSISLLRWLLRK